MATLVLGVTKVASRAAVKVARLEEARAASSAGATVACSAVACLAEVTEVATVVATARQKSRRQASQANCRPRWS